MLQRVLNNMNKLCLASMCDPEVEELVPTVYVMSYRDARSFLQAVGPWLRANPKAANTILPHSEMLSTLNHHQSGPSSTETHWIACWSLSSPQPSAREDPNGLPMEEDAHPGLAPQLCLVLMAAESCSGSWPVFLFSPSTPHPHTQDGPPLAEAVNATVSRLLELRPPQRTCSIFGPAPLVAVFSTIWEAHSIHPRQQAPLQRTKMLGLQNARAIHATIRVPRPGNIRAATESDIAVLINLLQLTSPVSFQTPHIFYCGPRANTTHHSFYLLSMHLATRLISLTVQEPGSPKFRMTVKIQTLAQEQLSHYVKWADGVLRWLS